MRPEDLPIFPFKDALLNAIHQYNLLLVVGETGSGKSTQIPQYILERGNDLLAEPEELNEEERDLKDAKETTEVAADSKEGGDPKPESKATEDQSGPASSKSSGKQRERSPEEGRRRKRSRFDRRPIRIAITQPRRVAAISVATRVAQELGVSLGSKIGYSIRFEDVSSSSTQLKYVTDGILLRECIEDPTLRRYDVVILDEAHERSLETDILFGLMKRTHKIRPDLKIIIMSATLNVQKFSEYFHDCPVFNIPGRIYPVDIFYSAPENQADLRSNYVKYAIDTVMHVHVNEEPGDILVFLTGRSEIEDMHKRLGEIERRLDYDTVKYEDVNGMMILPLYGSLETDMQKSIFDPPHQGYRKVVIATNIAATSVTIDGVRYVIDSGFVKQKMFDAASGVDALLVVPISKSAAAQRSGRAGRTSSGKCFRLFSRQFHDEKMDEETVPEIQRTGLTNTVLNLKKMGITDVLQFDFMEPPSKETIIVAMKELHLLGALTADGEITKTGELMTLFSLAPNMSRVLVASFENECTEEILTLLSMLSTEDPYILPHNKNDIPKATKAREALSQPGGDHMTLIHIYDTWEANEFTTSWARDNYLHNRHLKTARNIRKQLREIAEKHQLRIRSCKSRSGKPDLKLIIKCLAEGFFDHTAKKHLTGSVYYPLGVGKSENLAFFVHPSSVSVAEKFTLDCVVFHEIVYTTKAYMRCISPMDFTLVEKNLEKMKLVDIVRLCGPLAKPDAEPNIPQEHAEKPDEEGSGSRSQSAEEKEKEKEKEKSEIQNKKGGEKANLARARFLERQQHRKKK